MSELKTKLGYFFKSATKMLLGQPRKCPNCGHEQSICVQKKALVTELRRCSQCQILYRYPVDDVAEAAAFYQKAYSQGYTTDCPNSETLKKLLDTAFAGSERDYKRHLELLNCLKLTTGSKLIDYGCSWGYGSWQFKHFGYDVQAFEISEPRAAYAHHKLGVKVTGNKSDLKGPVQVFFSSHVLEHVPSVSAVIKTAGTLLDTNSLFIAITPNGSAAFANRQPKKYRQLWGQVHPNFLDEKFYAQEFKNQPYFISSTPFNLNSLKNWDRKTQIIDRTDGDELLVVAIFD